MGRGFLRFKKGPEIPPYPWWVTSINGAGGGTLAEGGGSRRWAGRWKAWGRGGGSREAPGGGRGAQAADGRCELLRGHPSRPIVIPIRGIELPIIRPPYDVVGGGCWKTRTFKNSPGQQTEAKQPDEVGA